MSVVVVKALAVIVGVVGAGAVAVAMILGPVISEPPPTTIEILVIIAYPLCMLLGGIFTAIHLRTGLMISLLAVIFAAVFAGLYVTGDPGSVGENVLFGAFVIAPAVILAGLCWGALCTVSTRAAQSNPA